MLELVRALFVLEICGRQKNDRQTRRFKPFSDDAFPIVHAANRRYNRRTRAAWLRKTLQTPRRFQPFNKLIDETSLVILGRETDEIIVVIIHRNLFERLIGALRRQSARRSSRVDNDVVLDGAEQGVDFLPGRFDDRGRFSTFPLCRCVRFVVLAAFVKPELGVEFAPS